MRSGIRDRQTYVGRRTDKIWIWTAINHLAPGILAMEIGDRSGQTFARLWQRIKTWDNRKYFSDGYCIYAIYIPLGKHQVLPKTKLTRVEGENTRLRHYLARLPKSNLMLLKINSNAEAFSYTFDALFKI